MTEAAKACSRPVRHRSLSRTSPGNPGTMVAAGLPKYVAKSDRQLSGRRAPPAARSCRTERSLRSGQSCRQATVLPMAGIPDRQSSLPGRCLP